MFNAVGLGKLLGFLERCMVDKNVKPNYVTLVSILPAISHLGVVELDKVDSFVLLREMVFRLMMCLALALMDMYSSLPECGSVDKALHVFPDTHHAYYCNRKYVSRASHVASHFNQIVKLHVPLLS